MRTKTESRTAKRTTLVRLTLVLFMSHSAHGVLNVIAQGSDVIVCDKSHLLWSRIHLTIHVIAM